MIGYELTYKPKDSYSRVMLNHRLFGRLVYVKARGKKVAYYKPGMVSNTPFTRLIGAKIFLTSLRDINLEELGLYGEVKAFEKERDDKGILLLTGEEYWRHVADEKGVEIVR